MSGLTDYEKEFIREFPRSSTKWKPNAKPLEALQNQIKGYLEQLESYSKEYPSIDFGEIGNMKDILLTLQKHVNKIVELVDDSKLTKEEYGKLLGKTNLIFALLRKDKSIIIKKPLMIIPYI